MLRLTQFAVLTIVGCQLILAGSPLLADEALFDRLDKDGDGVVDKSELGEADERLVKRLLRTSDKNGDGELSRDELSDGTTTKDEPKGRLDAQPQQNRPGQKMAFSPSEIIKRVDRDGDGSVSRNEAPERMKQNFDRIDSNGDGKISLKEFETVLSALRRGDNGKRPGTPPESAKKPGQEAQNGRKLIEIFRERDADQNGGLTVSEIPEKRRQEFLAQLKKIDRSPEEGISLPEFMKIGRQQISKGKGPNRDGDRPQPSNPTQKFGPTKFANEVSRQIEKIDEDGNGTISKDEAPQRLRQAFDKVDADGNGELDAKEQIGRASCRERV